MKQWVTFPWSKSVQVIPTSWLFLRLATLLSMWTRCWKAIKIRNCLKKIYEHYHYMDSAYWNTMLIFYFMIKRLKENDLPTCDKFLNPKMDLLLLESQSIGTHSSTMDIARKWAVNKFANLSWLTRQSRQFINIRHQML